MLMANMSIIKNPELKGIAVILSIALALGVLLAGFSGKLEQWGLPWFTGKRILDKIVFVSDRSGTNEVYVMNPDGTGQRQLTTDSKVLSAPTISAAGNRVAFVSMIGSVSQIMAVGSGGGAPYALTSSTGPKLHPQYSPDGKKLAYIESGRVWVAELNGSNPYPMLPTSEEMAGAMQDSLGRGEIPIYSAFAWGADSNSLVGISSQNRMTDAITSLTQLRGEAHYVIPPNDEIQITGLGGATAGETYAASCVLPGKSPRGVICVFQANDDGIQPLQTLPDTEFGTPAVSADGSLVVVSFEDNKEKRAGLLEIDATSHKSRLLCSGHFENPVFSAEGDIILAAQLDPETKKRSVVAIDSDSGEVTTLADDGDCFDAVFSPTSNK